MASLETELQRLKRIHTEMNRFTIVGEFSDLIKEIHVALPKLIKTIEIQREAVTDTIKGSDDDYSSIWLEDANEEIERLWNIP